MICLCACLAWVCVKTWAAWWMVYSDLKNVHHFCWILTQVDSTAKLHWTIREFAYSSVCLCLLRSLKIAKRSWQIFIHEIPHPTPLRAGHLSCGLKMPCRQKHMHRCQKTCDQASLICRFNRAFIKQLFSPSVLSIHLSPSLFSPRYLKKGRGILTAL